MSARHLFAAVASATAIALTCAAAGAGPALASPLPDPRPHLQLPDSPQDQAAAVLLPLRAEYAATHLRSAHNDIVLIVHNPASAVL